MALTVAAQTSAPIDVEWFAARRWWEDVTIGTVTECWRWRKSTGSHGYGQTWDGSRVLLAHRVAWVLHHGVQIPADLTIDHVCRNRVCVNPAHLRLLTNVDNARLNGMAIKTHCLRGHELAGSNVRLNHRGHRRCVTCQNERNAARYQVAA